MAGLGYLRPQDRHHRRITAEGTNVLQYVLAYYSRHPLGQRFWEETLRGTDSPFSLGL